MSPNPDAALHPTPQGLIFGIPTRFGMMPSQASITGPGGAKTCSLLRVGSFHLMRSTGVHASWQQKDASFLSLLEPRQAALFSESVLMRCR